MTAGPVAIIPVRDGVLAAGGHEVAAEVAAIATTTSAGPGTDARSEPRTILIGSVLGTAAGALAGLVRPPIRLGRVRLEDQHSSNGTYVRLRGERDVQPNDVLRVGDQVLRYEP